MILPRLLAAVLLGATATLAAQVPVTEDPRYRVTYSNAQLRVALLTLPPGDTSLNHRHDFDIATVSMSTGASTREEPSGQPWGSPMSRPLGDVKVAEYTGKPASHRVENVGKSPYQHVAVENLQKSGWSTTPPLAARLTTLKAESRAFRIYDVRVGGRETIQTSHKHANTTIVVNVSGAAMSEGPREQAKTYAPAAVGLKQLTQPGEWLLVPAGDTHHVVSLGASEAHLVEIELR